MRQKGEAARQSARAEEAEQASEQLRGKLKVCFFNSKWNYNPNWHIVFNYC